MCNRYRMSEKDRAIAEHFGVVVPPDLVFPNPELFPRREALVVREGEAGAGRVVDVMRWGFPPPGTSRAPVTNVRNLASPFWRTALGRPERRCLVPVTSFCEWEGEKGAKMERWFSQPAAPIFAFAGVWRPVQIADDKWERAFAFLTCEPNPLVAPIHPKAMPVILHPEDYQRWLTDSYASVCELAQPFPSQLLTVA
jgi:putative SOS response-associated peptidase YedK